MFRSLFINVSLFFKAKLNKLMHFNSLIIHIYSGFFLSNALIKYIFLNEYLIDTGWRVGVTFCSRDLRGRLFSPADGGLGCAVAVYRRSLRGAVVVDSGGSIGAGCGRGSVGILRFWCCKALRHQEEKNELETEKIKVIKINITR